MTFADPTVVLAEGDIEHPMQTVLDSPVTACRVSNTIGKIVAELRETLLGWKAYFGIAEVLSPLREIDKWVRRKLRCYL